MRGGPCHLCKFTQGSGDLIFLWGQLVHSDVENIISELVWISAPQLHSAPLINETYIQMLFSSSSSLSSGPSHSILLLLSVWAFQSKRERKQILRLFLNYSIKCSDASDSLTWSVWLIRHTPFQFHFISGGSTALETAEKRGRVRWRRASCCRPWRHLLALSIKTTKWASRERERRDFGAIFVCYLRKKKLFKRNGAAAVQVRAEGESSAEGWTPSSR